jgi:hypothetical protein
LLAVPHRQRDRKLISARHIPTSKISSSPSQPLDENSAELHEP